MSGLECSGANVYFIWYCIKVKTKIRVGTTLPPLLFPETDDLTKIRDNIQIPINYIQIAITCTF